MSRDQLAAAMNQAPGSGSFNSKVNTARMFGILDSATGKYQLTELGFEIVDPARSESAMVAAFLNVELYKKTYDEFRGKRLPPRPHGLEAAFIQLGVAPKQARNARLAFEKSARMAGFYPNGDEDRLVMPFGAPAIPPHAEEEASAPKAMVASLTVPQAMAYANPAPDIHPSIMGMVEELPPAKTEWSKAQQADWLQALAQMFRVIYKGEDGGTISVSLVRDPVLHSPPRREPSGG
jgi:hypothetical protein